MPTTTHLDLLFPLPPNNKDLTLQQVLMLLQQFQQQSALLSLRQKSSIITNLCKYFFTATHNWLVELQKVRNAICLAPAHSTKEKRDGRSTTNRKRIKRSGHQGVQNEEISLSDILQKVEEQSRVALQGNPDNMFVTPIRTQTVHDNLFGSTLPPFQPQIIAELSVEINSQQKSSVGGVSEQGWNPDLSQYRNMLGLTQKGIPIKSEKRSRNGTGIKTVVKVADNKIVVSQAEQYIHQLQFLTTKVKISKQRIQDESDYFNLQVEKINPQLKHVRIQIDQLRDRENILNINSFDELNRTQIVSHPIFTSFFSDSKKEEEHEVFLKNDPSLTEKLQEEIKTKIDEELFFKQSVSLNNFSRKNSIKRQIKAVLFYHLLHMDFELSQQNPSRFGDIVIHKNNS